MKWGLVGLPYGTWPFLGLRLNVPTSGRLIVAGTFIACVLSASSLADRKALPKILHPCLKLLQLWAERNPTS